MEEIVFRLENVSKTLDNLNEIIANIINILDGGLR